MGYEGKRQNSDPFSTAIYYSSSFTCERTRGGDAVIQGRMVQMESEDVEQRIYGITSTSAPPVSTEKSSYLPVDWVDHGEGARVKTLTHARPHEKHTANV